MPDPLVIGGVTLEDVALLDVQYTREPIGGSEVLRMSDGNAIKQTHWQKARVTIQASGWAPPALDAIDWSQPVLISGGGYPDVTVFSDGPRQSVDANAASHSWQLTGEEV
jgi:hypothetical protein